VCSNQQKKRIILSFNSFYLFKKKEKKSKYAEENVNHSDLYVNNVQQVAMCVRVKTRDSSKVFKTSSLSKNQNSSLSLSPLTSCNSLLYFYFYFILFYFFFFGKRGKQIIPLQVKKQIEVPLDTPFSNQKCL